MPLVSMRQLLDEAAKGGYGVGAFNVNNMEQIQAIMEAAKEIDAPVIVQARRGARSYSQDAYLRHLMLAMPAPRIGSRNNSRGTEGSTESARAFRLTAINLSSIDT